MTSAEHVTLWRMRRPSDNGEVACRVRVDATGAWQVSLTFEHVELPTLAQSTRSLTHVVRFSEHTRCNLLNAGWCDGDDEHEHARARAEG